MKHLATLLIILAATALTLTAACSSGSGNDNPPVGDPCDYSRDCTDAASFCVNGHCLAPEYAPVCNRPADCPDVVNQTCVNGRCLNYECNNNQECNTAKQEHCDEHKCYPDCERDRECIDRNGVNWICKDMVCTYVGGDEDLDQETTEAEEEYEDPCWTMNHADCSAVPNSCLYDLLHCADFAGRQWTYCYYEYNDSDDQIGRTIYFSDGSYFREYYGGRYEAGKGDTFCYFVASGRMDNEGDYLTQQGEHLAYLYMSNSYIRIECPDKPVECYDTLNMYNCAEFPYPPFPYVPSQDRPLTCTNRPEEK